MNTSHHHGGDPGVFLKTARAVNAQREYTDANERVAALASDNYLGDRRRPPRPIAWWFEQKDAYAWGLVQIQLQILQRQENGEPLGDLPRALAHHQGCLDTITPKCERLFKQWNRCDGGRK